MNMSADPSHVAAWLLGTAYTATAAVVPQSPLNEHQIVIVAIVAGLVGGLIATLAADGSITIRTLILRMLSAGLLAPSVLWIIMRMNSDTEFTVFPVMAAAGVAGSIAWPLAQALPNLVPDILKQWLRGLFGGKKDGS